MKQAIARQPKRLPKSQRIPLDDLTRAAKQFRPIYERTNAVDGWVSLEVSPLLAYDNASTVEGAKELYGWAVQPNLFIKIPGTKEGLPAIEESIFAGIPVNVTLLFSSEQYLAASAWIRAIERRIDAGLNPEVGSVASVFVKPLGRIQSKLFRSRRIRPYARG